MIAEGRIAIDGKPVETPATLLASLHGVTVDGKPVKAPAPARLFRYHKPAGLLTAERDPKGRPTIYDRLPKGLPRLMPVGRLDINTEGLLLLTTDGELKRQLELPATGVERSYRARVFGEVTQAQLEELIHGIEIEGVRYGAINANLERRTGRNRWIEMRLREGKNREVRRVLEHLGLKVSRLIRTAYGPFALGDLPAGAVDEVRQHDLVAFRKVLGSDLPRQGRASAAARLLAGTARGEARPRSGRSLRRRPAARQRSDRRGSAMSNPSPAVREKIELGPLRASRSRAGRATARTFPALREMIGLGLLRASRSRAGRATARTSPAPREMIGFAPLRAARNRAGRATARTSPAPREMIGFAPLRAARNRAGRATARPPLPAKAGEEIDADHRRRVARPAARRAAGPRHPPDQRPRPRGPVLDAAEPDRQLRGPPGRRSLRRHRRARPRGAVARRRRIAPSSRRTARRSTCSAATSPGSAPTSAPTSAPRRSSMPRRRRPRSTSSSSTRLTAPASPRPRWTVAGPSWLAPGGWISVEYQGEALALPAGLEIETERRYGKAQPHIVAGCRRSIATATALITAVLAR